MQNLLFLLIMTFGVFMQALVGFGGTLLAMPLGILVAGIGMTKPVMTILAWITGVVVVIREYRYIRWRELAKMVAVMLVGVVGGIWVMGRVQLDFLLLLYALVVIAIGAKRLFFPTRREPPRAVQNAALAVAGVMQGLFVSGGSFLAVYAVERFPEKREFRATVNAVWAVVNIVMVALLAADGALTREVLTMAAAAVIPTLGAVWLGGYLTRRVRQETFLKLIYVLLIVSGAVLLITNLQ